MRFSTIYESIEPLNASSIKFTNNHIDFSYGQNDFELIAYDTKTKKIIASLSYSILKGEKIAHINYIHVDPQYRRKGIGKALIKQLLMNNIAHKIDWGLHTPQGLELRLSLEAQGYKRFFV